MRKKTSIHDFKSDDSINVTQNKIAQLYQQLHHNNLVSLSQPRQQYLDLDFILFEFFLEYFYKLNFLHKLMNT